MAHVRDMWYTADRRPTVRHGQGKRWMAVWIGPDRTGNSKAFGRKVDAERFVAAVEADMLRGTYVDPRRGAIRVRDYAEDKFLPTLIHLRPNSAVTYESHLRTHVYPALGDYRIGALGKADVKSFVAAKARELAPSTVETVIAVLRTMLAAAVEDGVIPVNPCSRVGLPQVMPRVLQPLEPAEVLALQAALPARYRVAVSLGAGAGLRFGEATGLTVPRVRRDACRIQVLEQAQNDALAPLKTKASRRNIPVGEWVLAEIDAHLDKFGPGPHQLVMSTAHGGFVHRNAFGDMWRRAVRLARTCGKPAATNDDQDRRQCADKCASPAHMVPHGTRFHDLRHFYASALIAANLNPKVIQARLGHATVSETMDTYGHLFADADDLGIQAVDEALASALEVQRRYTALFGGTSD
jgi:integrase